MAQQKYTSVRAHGHQREQLDAVLLPQVVIGIGRQLARKAGCEELDEDESLPPRLKPQTIRAESSEERTA
jgi:hypothetical protein